MATVDFTVAELLRERGAWSGAPIDDASGQMLQDFIDRLARAGARRGAEDAMDHANTFLDGHGVEAIRVEGAHVDNYHFDIVATYVNMGDTYSLTIVHDSETNTFHLTSWGDFVEAYEQEHPREDSCASCGQMFPVSELDADTSFCDECRDAATEAAAAERGEGRRFDVTVHRGVDGASYPVEAFWEDRDDPLMVIARTTRAQSPSGQALYTSPGLMRGHGGILWHYDAGTRPEDSGWRLSEDSIAVVLVEMDRFLEST